MFVEIVVLRMSIAALPRGKDLVAAGDRAVIHLLGMDLFEVFLEDEVVAELLLADVALGVAVGIRRRRFVRPSRHQIARLDDVNRRRWTRRRRRWWRRR